jgi:3-phosphoshikimate 1-carboxyvinyltransferase
MSNLQFYIQPGGSLVGATRVPGDKSVSHRSIMLGSLADGNTKVEGFLQGEDSLATLRAFRAMGVKITDPEEGRLEIQGVGLEGLQPADDAIDVGNSGTSMRLMAGLLAGQKFDSVLTGDSSLVKRPMSRVAAPLSLMGAQIDTAPDGTAPLRILGGKNLVGIEYPMPIASAQVKSCLLLAGLYAQGETAVLEPAPTRDHTERMLRTFGVEVTTIDGRSCIPGGQRLTATNIQVPGDISSAAFLLVGASIIPGSDLILEGVGINPTRDGVLQILRLMGADIDVLNTRDVGGEPIADLHIRHTQLQGIDIPENLVPLAIDEFPALFIAAAVAEGTTRLTGAEELRVKESDRIQVMADGLQSLGVKAIPRPDGIEIEGGKTKGGQVNSRGDHRIAMSFAIAGALADGDVLIDDCANVATSYPNFVQQLSELGLLVKDQLL